MNRNQTGGRPIGGCGEENFQEKEKNFVDGEGVFP